MSRKPAQLDFWSLGKGSHSKDLRGMRFGLLTVPTDSVPEYRPRKPSEPGLGGPAYWPCVCDCGTTVTVIGRQLRAGRIVSCLSNSCRVKGLLATGRTLPRQLGLHIPPIGKKFGRLTVIGATSSSEHGGKRRWLFKCDCGTTKEQFAAKVTSGQIQSCGCLMRESVSVANSKYKDRLQQYRNSLLSGYKRHAKDRDLAFEISNEDFFELTKQSCAYCGRTEANTGSLRYKGKLPHNGVDRLDSSKGYVQGNCVACCKTCNIMKQRMSVDEFVSHLELVLRHIKGVV